MLASYNNYITAEDLYKMDFRDTVMYNVQHDSSSEEITLLVLLKSIRLDVEGNITMTSVEIENSSLRFISIEGLSGIAIAKMNILFRNITIKNSSYTSGNAMMTFGPIYTRQDIEFSIRDSLFENLNFYRGLSLIHIFLQGPNAFILDS
jgi:hypothetical protein